ncbi:MAG: tRNA lysidine(34) synthetase TilS, partial [Propioniciclava sp.]
MARKALGPATLAVVQVVDALPPQPWTVACSGGADSLALAWAASHVAARRGTPVAAVVVDHGLQP